MRAIKRLTVLLLTLLLAWAGSASAAQTRAEDLGRGVLRIPVVPVEFSDCRFEAGDLETLEAALNGSSEETGWHSVRSYYLESSYGALDVRFDLLPVFEAPYPSFFYALQYVTGIGELYPEERLLRGALQAADETTDFSLYDRNQDGLLDGVLVIYAHASDYDAEDSLWWAWQDQSILEEEFDGLLVDYYLWAGIDMLEEPTGLLTDVPCALTYIHETGHLLGLMDYYDALPEDGLWGGLGYADMMDGSLGDHCSFSKQELGWIEPTPIEQPGSYALRAFSATGDALILRNPDARDEYLLIDLYAPDGLNQPFAESGELFTQQGVRIYHVDAAPRTGPDHYTDPYLCTNSSGEHPLLCLVEADGDGSLAVLSEDAEGWAADSDLFHEGDALQGFTWYTGAALGYTLRVERLSGDKAVLRCEAVN